MASEQSALHERRPDKQRFERSFALLGAKELCDALKPVCSRLIVAGSLRRRKATVGDVEILYICTRGMVVPHGEIFSRMCNVADGAIDSFLERGILSKRTSKKGAGAWGEKNKLAAHNRTGIPVDLFAATEDNWWNYLVCRTGHPFSAHSEPLTSTETPISERKNEENSPVFSR